VALSSESCPLFAPPTSMANGLFQVVSVASGFCLGKKFCTLMSRTAGGIRVGCVCVCVLAGFE